MDPLPDDWRLARLGDSEIAEIRGSKKFPNYENVAFIPMECIPDSGTYAKYEVRPRSQIKSFTYCEKGDLLLAKITPSLENGKQGIVPDNVPNGFALATTEVFPISCKRMNSLFLFYVLKHSCFRNKIISSMTGTTGRQRATKESVEKLLIPFPPLFEQRKIAEILSTVDQAIQKVMEAIDKTERLKKDLMQELLTKGIGHKEFKKTEIGMVPKDWEVVKLSEIGNLQYGYTASAIKRIEGVRFVRITDIDDSGKINWGSVPTCKIDKANYLKYKLNDGDILFARIGATTGKSALIDKEIDGVFASYLIRFKRNQEYLDSRFLHFFTQSNRYWLQVHKNKEGQLKKGINAKILAGLFVPLPPPSEQQKIAEILSSVDKRIETLRKRKERLEKVKRGLMEDLLTGKKRVKLED